MLSTNNAISILENGLLGVPRFEFSKTKKAVEGFQNFLTTCSMSLSSVSEVKCEELEYILTNIENQISGTLKKIRQRNAAVFCTDYYKCNKCHQVIYVDMKKNIWEYLQCHNHFEEMYCEALSKPIVLRIEDIEPTLNDSVVENVVDYDMEGSSDSNSEINVDTMLDMNTVSTSDEICPEEINSDNDVNGFRFDFDLHYDEVVLSKLYPEGLIKSVKKIDKCKDPTIRRISGSTAVCLLCGVKVMSKSRMSKATILDHVIGQRHLSLTVSDEHINRLRRYHELWLSYECSYQAHQVFFMPKGYNLECMLCKKADKTLIKNDYTTVKDHIDSSTHKNILIKMYVSDFTSYYLAYEQAQVYDISKEELKKMLNVSVEGKADKKSAKQKSKNTALDSSTSGDPANGANTEKRKKVEPKSHNIIKSVTDEKSTNILDRLPNRSKNHCLFLTLTADRIFCKACQLTLNKTLDIVMKHTMNEQHLKVTGLKTLKYDYYCEICNIKISDEGLWQEHFTTALNNHINMAESRKVRVTEYECTVCHTVIFGDELSLARHLSVKSGTRRKQQKEIKLPDTVKKMFKSKEFINVQTKSLTDEANATAESSELTAYCCERLEAALSSCFPDCDAHPFGSRISGLGHAYSDLDVFIDTGDMYTGTQNQDSVSQVKIVRKVANQLSKYKEEFQDILRIAGARTPIVQVYHTFTNIDCDLSFRHGLCVENTKFLRFCIELQPITQPLILFIKKWSETNNLRERDQVSNYLLSMMAIFFLQTQRHLLSIKKLREINNGVVPVISGWNTVSYTTPIKQVQKFVEPCNKSITELLKDFFHYYSKFRYDTDVVCPLLGYTLRKTVFENNSSLPPEMKSYVNKLKSGDPELFKYTSSFCVQDPFDLSHNLSKAWQPSTVNKFKTLCNLSYQHLNSL